MRRLRFVGLTSGLLALGLVACGQDQALDTDKEASARVEEEAAAATEAATKEVKGMIRELKTLIGEERMEEARVVMDRLAAIRDSLSEELQDRIDRLKAMMPDA
jgi:predicted nucleic acid-binding protein